MINPCNCGNEQIYVPDFENRKWINYVGWQVSREYYCECSKCLRGTNIHSTYQKAIEEWNKDNPIKGVTNEINKRNN